MNEVVPKPVKNYRRSKPSQPPVRIYSLGGLGEIGKNMYGIEFRNEIIIIDAGLKFPDSKLSGIDYIIPDVSYLVKNQHKIKGLFLTHGHEDHIGALPFVLRQLKVPVYGGPLTIGLVRAKLEEYRMLEQTELHVFQENDRFAYKHLTVHFFRTTHSIPDAFGIVVDTPYGAVVHTGDFKFDFTPEDHPANIAKMASVGSEGVLALLADSTNSEKDGFTPSEHRVGNAILETFHNCHGRILFAMFASNVNRLQQVVDAAIMSNRKIAVIGRSMERVFAIGQDLGYIRVPDGMLIDIKQIDKYEDNRILIICTGSQGEPNAALSRIASGAHRSVSIYPGDSVVFSSSPIPGNGPNINRCIDLLMRAGANVIYGSVFGIHASGHGCREDLKLMLRFIQPKYFIPIHGEYRMLLAHKKLAMQTGMNEEQVFLMNLGDTLSVYRNRAKRGRSIPAGEVIVSNGEIRTFEEELVEEREVLAQEGIVIVVMTVDVATRQILAGPDIVTRGFVYMQDARPLLRRAEMALRRSLKKLGEQGPYDSNAWVKTTNRVLRRFFIREVGRTPHIMPSILEV
ncbi:ribonuclease J [Paenibacillus lutimineralis]|uniref:Ribonuclease J n=1 Tax=Paenibacillus lutimineralis TaxID=2707005 RepID=A0A3Q9I7I5_9BACL|nr:ribonuclease J [Paenibacillus lutimineralis]AZS14368.1 ribonuclease J [Paenibacillus lutimineralis]